MQHGKDFRDEDGKPLDQQAEKEIPVLMFVMREHAPGVFVLRFVQNESVIGDLRVQGVLQGNRKSSVSSACRD